MDAKRMHELVRGQPTGRSYRRSRFQKILILGIFGMTIGVVAGLIWYEPAEIAEPVTIELDAQGLRERASAK